MSQRRYDYGTTHELFAGTSKIFRFQIIDPETGEPKSLLDDDVYATGKVKWVKIDFSLIGTFDVSYVTRSTGIVEYYVDSDVSTNENAGNWIGELELFNTDGKTVEQQRFNANIYESNTA